MRKTNDEISTAIYKYVKNSLLGQSITGTIYNGEDRDLNSTTEDIVVKVLSNQTSELQMAYVNVNVYVQCYYDNGMYRKNDERLPLLERLSMDSLEVFRAGDARVVIESQTTMLSDNGKENVINNRLFYKIVN